MLITISVILPLPSCFSSLQSLVSWCTCFWDFCHSYDFYSIVLPCSQLTHSLRYEQLPPLFSALQKTANISVLLGSRMKHQTALLVIHTMRTVTTVELMCFAGEWQPDHKNIICIKSLTVNTSLALLMFQ